MLLLFVRNTVCAMREIYCYAFLSDTFGQYERLWAIGAYLWSTRFLDKISCDIAVLDALGCTMSYYFF